MPYTKRKQSRRMTRRQKQKQFRRRNLRRNVRNKSLVPMGLGFPKKLLFTHKYVENLTLTTTVGNQLNYLFRANGMYDPNQTSTGHQPLYFDQLSAIYDHYCVIGSKCTVRFTPLSASTAPTHLMLRIDDDTSVPTNTQETMEQSGSRFKLLPAGASYTTTLSTKWSAKKFFGGAVLANNDLQGTATSDPTEESFFQIAIRPMDGSTDVSVYVQVFIEYIAVWKELKNIASS